MEPALNNGATVGIDTSKKNIVDGKMYAVDHGGMLRVKMLYRLPGGVKLRSFNMEEHPDEVVAFSEIRIIGRVFWSSNFH
jgi:phage repressor protein C with HTH and peptisase S24 domain